jgi:hypothetical protein
MTARFNWNPASWEPMNIDLPILAWTNNDKLVVFKNTKSYMYGKPVSDFKRLVEKYNIKFWVYQVNVINNHPYNYDD